MNSRWMFSQFYTDPLLGMMAPVASAYGSGWSCPVFPTTEGASALCLVNCDQNQLAAAAQDTRVVVCPMMFDMTPVAPAVIAEYSSLGATSGMSIGTLIATLAATEPVFAHVLTN